MICQSKIHLKQRLSCCYMFKDDTWSLKKSPLLLCCLPPGAPTVIQILVSKMQRTFVSVIYSQNSTLPWHLDVSSSSPPKISCVYLVCSWNCNGLAYFLLVFFLSFLCYSNDKDGHVLHPSNSSTWDAEEIQWLWVFLGQVQLHLAISEVLSQENRTIKQHKIPHGFQKTQRAFCMTLRKGRRRELGRQNSPLNENTPLTLETGSNSPSSFGNHFEGEAGCEFVEICLLLLSVWIKGVCHNACLSAHVYSLSHSKILELMSGST